MLCACGRHAPQPFQWDCTAGVGGGGEGGKGRVEMVSVYNWLGLLYCWMKSLFLAGTFSPIAVLKICLPKGQVVRAFSVVQPKIYLSRAIRRVVISSPVYTHTHTLARACACMRAWTRNKEYIHAHTCMLACTCGHTHTHVRASACPPARPPIPTQLITYTRTVVHQPTSSCIHEL